MERGICQDGNRKVAQRKLACYPLYVVGTSVIQETERAEVIDEEFK